VTTLQAALAVAAGGALGALARWGVSVATARGLAGHPTWGGFPLGTVLVNVVGAFALAWLVSAGEARGVGSPALRLFLGTGLLGALTTFSTFGLDAHGLFDQGRGGQALLYLGGTLVLAGIAVVLGWAAGR
jgi:CrcB protein